MYIYKWHEFYTSGFTWMILCKNIFLLKYIQVDLTVGYKLKTQSREVAVPQLLYPARNQTTIPNLTCFEARSLK